MSLCQHRAKGRNCNFASRATRNNGTATRQSSSALAYAKQSQQTEKHLPFCRLAFCTASPRPVTAPDSIPVAPRLASWSPATALCPWRRGGRSSSTIPTVRHTRSSGILRLFRWSPSSHTSNSEELTGLGGADVVTQFIEGLVETYPGLQYLDGFPEVRLRV